MPQNNPIRQNSIPIAQQKPLQIAQTETHRPVTGETTATTQAEPKEKDHTGEIPKAPLLFWNSLMIVFLMVALALASGKRNSPNKAPRGLQSYAEYIADQMNAFVTGIIGPGGEKYTPLVGTLFLYIFAMNLLGTIPIFHSPTANLSITLALGLVVFVYVQYEGIRQNGIGGHFSHFLGPKLGKYPLLAPLMLPIELISEGVRPFTLAVRLFGNIFGEDVIIIVLAGLGATLGGSLLGWIPIQVVLLPLALLTSFVQALVFSILTCIYLSLVQHHSDGEHGDLGDLQEGPAHATGH